MLRKLNERLKGYRTLIVALVLAAVDTLQETDIAPILPPSWVPWWVVLHPFIFAGLRVITKGPVGVAISA